MKNIIKNKIFLGVLAILVVLGIAAVFIIVRPNSQESTNDELTDETLNVKQVFADDLGLELSSKQNGQVVNMKISNVEGISSIEYDLTYDAEVEGLDEPTGRGVTGVVEINGKPVNEDIDLGTCSRKVCKYDTVVSDVTVILRINYENGEVGVAEAKISITNRKSVV